MGVPSPAEKLAEVILELTDTLGEEFDAATLFQQLATVSTELLAVDAAGVLLLAEDGRLVPVAATHVSIDRLGRLQAVSGQGPGVDSVRTQTCVTCPDLDQEVGRWTHFAALAQLKGFRAVSALPLRLHSDVVGGLVLFQHGIGTLSETDQR